MNFDLIPALMLFALVSSITPGPNNLMLMSSGANFGFRRTLPHMIGVSVGFLVMLVLVGIGVMQLFDIIPYSFEVLRVACLLYLCYLAYRIATSSHVVREQQSSQAKPFSFVQAVLFQWVNPKAWTMALSAISVYAPSRDVAAVVIVGVVFVLVNLPCIGSWTIAGQKLSGWLHSAARLRIFNMIMATLLVCSVLPSLLS
ncbi:LysE family translocator [Pseudoalteromonas sp. YIC-656]|uniref:LysE family translocator n=1 Tax=Pseudoalteromonas pernae TaxID=3118054 RepID=UPI00324250FF